MTYCGKCGAENPDGNGFCYKCGARLEGSPYRSASDVREIKVERPEPPKAARLEEVPDNGSPYRSFKDVRTRTAAGTNAEVPGEENTDTVTDYTKVDLPGVRRKAPRSNDHTSVLAVVIVAVVLIVACVSIYYMMPGEDDGDGEYHTVYDIPRDHPLYGVETPDGTYVYEGTAVMQGHTVGMTLKMTLEDERFTYYELNGTKLSQSELDELNATGADTTFRIGSMQLWNDGSRTYDVYPLIGSDGSVTSYAVNGVPVYMEAEYQGVTMELTLDGWSRGAYRSADSSGDILVIGPGNIEMDTTGRAF